MATSFDSFLPYILPYAPGASDPVAYQALRDAAIDFCRRSLIVQRVAAQNVVATTQTYTVTVPTDMQFNRLLGVGWNGTWLPSVSPDDVENDTVLQGATIGTNVPQSGSPQQYFQKTPTDVTFGLFPIPDTSLANGLTVKAAFIPTMTCTALEDVLFNDYAEALAAGALMRLVVMPNQPFTAPSMAPAYKAVYEAGVNEAKRQREHGKLTSNRRVRPVNWAI